jgi:integrase
LRQILEEVRPNLAGKALVTNERGEPYSESGLRTMIYRLAAELSMKPGLTIHGLRHSLGRELYDLGVAREARKALMAHESDAASKIYERDGDRSRQADKAVRLMNRRHKGVGNENRTRKRLKPENDSV